MFLGSMREAFAGLAGRFRTSRESPPKIEVDLPENENTQPSSSEEDGYISNDFKNNYEEQMSKRGSASQRAWESEHVNHVLPNAERNDEKERVVSMQSEMREIVKKLLAAHEDLLKVKKQKEDPSSIDWNEVRSRAQYLAFKSKEGSLDSKEEENLELFKELLFLRGQVKETLDAAKNKSKFDYQAADFDPLRKLRETYKILKENTGYTDKFQKTQDQEFERQYQQLKGLLDGRQWNGINGLEKLGSDGKFGILREISGGGMGNVYLVWNAEKQILQIIKTIKEKLKEEKYKNYFEREKLVMAGLVRNNNNLARVFDYMELENGDKGLVMEYIPGQNLEAYLDAKTSYESMQELDLEAVKILGGIGMGLRTMHELGVTHHDLKPANVIMRDNTDGSITPVLIDQGLARLYTPAIRGELAHEHNLSEEGVKRLEDLNREIVKNDTGSFVGSPHYSAPETGIDQELDPVRAEVYSFGSLAYKILTGDEPFQSNSSQGLLVAKLTEQPRDINEVITENHRVSKTKPGEVSTLTPLIKNLMERDVAKRPGSIQETLELLFGAFLENYPNLKDEEIDYLIKDLLPSKIVNPREFLIDKYRKWSENRGISGEMAVVLPFHAKEERKKPSFISDVIERLTGKKAA